jgi:error-prone DNA polymerase
MLENRDGVQHVVVEQMLALDNLIQALPTHSRDFH